MSDPSLLIAMKPLPPRQNAISKTGEMNRLNNIQTYSKLSQILTIVSVIPPVVHVSTCNLKIVFSCVKLSRIMRFHTCNNVAELGHIVDLSPSMFTNPAISARVIGINGWRQDVEVAIVRWSHPVVLILPINESKRNLFLKTTLHSSFSTRYLSVNVVLIPVVAGHDASVAIRPSQHVRNSHLD